MTQVSTDCVHGTDGDSPRGLRTVERCLLRGGVDESLRAGGRGGGGRGLTPNS